MHCINVLALKLRAGWKGIVARQQSMQYKNEQINTPPRAQTMFK